MKRNWKGVATIGYLFVIALLMISLFAYADSRTLTGTITCVVPAGLEEILDQGAIAFTIDPDTSPNDQATRIISVGTNAAPVAFGISLLHHSPMFSYRLTEQGVASSTWKAIPVLPGVSSETLSAFGWTDYVFDLQATALFDLAAGAYQDDVQLRFQASGIIHTYLLHVTTTVLPRSPVVDAGPDQTVNEGDVVAFAGSFIDPDIGETYTFSWDFGDGTTASGTLTPTHTYLDDGTHTVTLTVTDSGGRAGQDTATIVVNDFGPTAHVESVPPVIPPITLAVDAGEEVTFDASGSTSSPDAIVSYEWDWNYGGIAGFTPSGDTGEKIAHTFDTAGTYTVAVRVTDDDGSTDVATLDVVVNSVTTAKVSLATPEVAGGGAAAVSRVAIDELYVHQQALAVSQFHLISAEPPETPSDPVIYFPFGEGAGKYIYNEIDKQSGKEPVLKGRLSQAEWTEGDPACGNAFALNLGEDGFVEIPADSRMSFTWNQDFTLELWVRTTDATTERTLVQRKRSDDSLLYSLDLFEGVPLFQSTTTTGSYAIVKGYKAIADGTWHHIACMRENGVLKLYVDGDLIDELLPEVHAAGAGGANLSSEEPSYLGGAEDVREIMGGLVDAVYYISEPIGFRMQIADETGTPVTDASPSLLFIRYDNAGQQVESGFIGRLEYSPDEEEYAYSLDTSTYEEGIYDFFLISGDGSQERLRIMLLEIE